jgi:hypothetical protein
MAISEADVIGSPGSVSGDFESTANAFAIPKKKKSGVGTAILQGQNTCYDSVAKAQILCPIVLANQKPPFGVCVKDTVDADTKVEVFDQDGQIMDSKAGLAIPAGAPIKPSVTVAGTWDPFIAGTDAAHLYQADYLGHPITGEGDGKTFATDAIAGDVIKIRKKGN